MLINSILLVAGTKFGPKFSRNFCSSFNSVLVKLMIACFLYDDVFYLLFFNILDFLIRWFLFSLNSLPMDFSVVQSISAKRSSFVLLFQLSQICFTFTVASCSRCLPPFLAITMSLRLYSFMMLNAFLVFIGLFSWNDFGVILWCIQLCKNINRFFAISFFIFCCCNDKVSLQIK